MSKGKILGTILLVFLTFVLAGNVAAQPSSTECTLNPESPACQKPYFADDQAEYLYDLRASWAFNDGAPDSSGPTAFQGGEAGSLTNRNSDTASGNTKTEYYIENPGPAEGGIQQNFGRGTLTNTDISISGAKTGNDPLGQYLITGPYSGQCGDGRKNVGDEVSCPEDYGTPKVVKLKDEPAPDRSTTFAEPEGKYTFEASWPYVKDIPQEGGSEGNNYWVVDSHSFPSGSYIGRDKVRINEDKVFLQLNWESVPFDYKEVSDSAKWDDVQESETTETFFTGEVKESSSKEICSNTERSGYWEHLKSEEPPNLPYKEVSCSGEWHGSHCTTEKSSSMRDYQGPESRSNHQLYVNLTTGEITRYLVNPILKCTDWDTVYEGCQGARNDGCDKITRTYPDTEFGLYEYGKYTEEETFKAVYDELIVFTDKKFWGPVNHRPEIFNQDISGLSSDDVVNSQYGYHSNVLRDNKKGSNDPSVSSNRYTLIEGDNYFEAHRKSSNVANVDGRNGEGDGIIAYHEEEGIKGMTDGLFKNEIFNGEKQNYVTKEDLPGLNCPVDTIRCIISVDLYTKESGWGDNPEDSIGVEVN